MTPHSIIGCGSLESTLRDLFGFDCIVVYLGVVMKVVMVLLLLNLGCCRR